MSNHFFDKPILNSPYDYPSRHWELDDQGQPTQEVIESRRKCSYVTPVPQPKKSKKSSLAAQQDDLFAEKVDDIIVDDQLYDPTSIVNEVRAAVDAWRKLPHPRDWGVTPETARLLQYWRTHEFTGIRPFFCQIEAVETAIWLSEVARNSSNKAHKKLFQYLEAANSHSDLFRLALKLATGAGKTTVMAMLIAWQTVNANHRPNSKHYSNAFLIVAPGITIRDRLRVLLPNDPESYYFNRELVPADMRKEIEKARIVITNYHAFQRREKVNLATGTRALLRGHAPYDLDTRESEGEMVRRVVGSLMGCKNIIAINDEAHHCYRDKRGPDAVDWEDDLKGDDKKVAKQQNEYARLWINGLEAVKRVLGISIVYDLSATPFYLAGSGYREGTLFPWVMSDFSLMDAIECGIVKLPRVPIADNVPDAEHAMPKLRRLWDAMKDAKQSLPKMGRGTKTSSHDPLSLPPLLITALDALYGHYEKTYRAWKDAGIIEPPVFIVVCQNTNISDLVYRYISGFEYESKKDGTIPPPYLGKFELFRNFDSNGNRLARPNALLIDSEQLESGDALDPDFRQSFGTEIEQFRRDLIQRSGNPQAAENIDDATLLREVMNTVGKKGRLGEQIRCVVSVSMLTEGWDANNVTHILGVRAFGTQLLCEQVVGRGLRRRSYELNSEGLFDVEYSDILGIPFDFTAKPVVAGPEPPPRSTHVQAVSPERDDLALSYPRVIGYRVEPPGKDFTAQFSEDSTLVLTPENVGPTRTIISGIAGQTEELTVEHLKNIRPSTILLRLTMHLQETKFRDESGDTSDFGYFGALKRITRQWLNNYLKCEGGTYPAQVLIPQFTDEACNRIANAIVAANPSPQSVLAILDPYNPTGSTHFVNFRTSKGTYQADPKKSHINYVVPDSDWETQFAMAAEHHPQVLAYAKNQGLGLEVPYHYKGHAHRYLPDFLLTIDDGHGADDPLHLIVEIKGYRGENAKAKADAMNTHWIPGINNLKKFGRWVFIEITQPYTMEEDLSELIREEMDKKLAALPHSESETEIALESK